jgi:hypothetical protein
MLINLFPLGDLLLQKTFSRRWYSKSSIKRLKLSCPKTMNKNFVIMAEYQSRICLNLRICVCKKDRCGLKSRVEKSEILKNNVLKNQIDDWILIIDAWAIMGTAYNARELIKCFWILIGVLYSNHYFTMIKHKRPAMFSVINTWIGS